MNNIQFIYYYLKFRPSYIHFGNEYMFKCLCIPLLFVKAKIIFRLGDEPVTTYFYNRFIWKNIICKKVCTFVCVSKFIQKRLEESGRILNNKDKVIYNFPPTRMYATSMENKHDGFVIGFVGQISENKGVAILVQAAIALCKKYSHISFVFAGVIDANPFANKILKHISEEEISIQKRISFIGHVDDIASFYSRLDICVTPSIYREALGNVIVEAKLYNKPSVIFQTGGMPELVHHCHDGYICSSKTVDALIDGLEYYIQDPLKAKEHGKNAFTSITEMKLDYKSYKEKWIDVYS